MKIWFLFFAVFYSLTSFAVYKVLDPQFAPPDWTTGTRPTCPSDYGCFGYNTTIKQIEFWNGTTWGAVGLGDLKGPASSTNLSLAIYDGTTGKLLKDGAGSTYNGAGGLTLGTVGTSTGSLKLTGIMAGATTITAPANGVVSNLTLPDVGPSAGDSLHSDATGKLRWAVSPIIKDSVGTTSVSVEGTPADGITRFTNDGSEIMRITKEGMIGIGTTSPNANAIVDMDSTTKAFMPPRMTTAQMNAIAAPGKGMFIMNVDNNQLAYHNGSSWVSLGSTSGMAGLGIIDIEPTFTTPAVPAGGYVPNHFYIVDGNGAVGAPFNVAGGTVPGVTDAKTGDWLVYEDHGGVNKGWEKVEFSNVGQIVRSGNTADNALMVWDGANANSAKDMGGLKAAANGLSIGSITGEGSVKFFDTATKSLVLGVPAALTDSYSLILPAKKPADNQILVSDAAGDLAWADKSKSYSWKADTLAGYSANNLAIPYFTNVDGGNTLVTANCGTVVNDAASGLELTLTRDVEISATIVAKTIGVGYPIGFSVNASLADADASIDTIPVGKIGCISEVLGTSTAAGGCSFTSTVKSGDVLRLHAAPGLVWANTARFAVNISCRE